MICAQMAPNWRSEIISDALKLETDLISADSPFIRPGRGFELLLGTRRALVIAPHATTHVRVGRLKFGEIGTASLALALHQLTGCSMIYTNTRSPEDPSFVEDGPLKRAVESVARAVEPEIILDLHSLKPTRLIECDLATMRGRSLQGSATLLWMLISELRAAGLQRITMDAFPATRPATITHWATKRKLTCIQCEVRSDWLLQPGSDTLQKARFASLSMGLARFLIAVSEERPQECFQRWPHVIDRCLSLDRRLSHGAFAFDVSEDQ
jgi:hypothetical protein